MSEQEPEGTGMFTVPLPITRDFILDLEEKLGPRQPFGRQLIVHLNQSQGEMRI